ncbi:MAG: tyrosine-type recombinase/integrase [Oscillospiraceae bacterium]|nr:tyrosine-type recombinase/integrase [Oscillospiraceae bacterium]
MICPKCRKDSPPDAAFCPYCGRKLAPGKPRRAKSRGNGTGCAYWDPVHRYWVAQIVDGYRELPAFSLDNPENRKQRIPIKKTKSGFKRREDALAYCQTLKNGEQKPDAAPTLAHYWETYKSGAYEALSASKQQAYRTAWNKLEKIKDTRIDQLTVSGLQDLVAEKCSSYYTTRDVRTLLINLFRIAAAEGYVRQEIPTFIQLPHLEETEQTPFSETEQKALWKSYEDGDIRAAVPLLMIYTGMMPGEAMKLKVEQIDIPGRRIHGAGMKTKVRKNTDIVLADSIVPVVQDLIDHAQPSGYIWKRDEKEWYQNYHAVLQDAGCRDLPPYSCRHTTATALAVTKNIAPQTVRKVMRWSTARMLDRYAHPDQDDALDAVNTLKKASE